MNSRHALVAISLKMYMGHRETAAWLTEIATIAGRHEGVREGAVRLVVLPGFVSIPTAVTALAGTAAQVGAQDLFWEDSGAFTGEVSGATLRDAGCSHVEVGHAERRRIFHESDAVVAAKSAAAVRNGLVPIICVGEPERVPAAAAADICIAQLTSALADVPAHGEPVPVVVAYEPVWAIGADEYADAHHIDDVCKAVGGWLSEQQHLSAASDVIYGGTAGPGLLRQLACVDGLFLGRRAHDPEAVRQVLDEARDLLQHAAAAPMVDS